MREKFNRSNLFDLLQCMNVNSKCVSYPNCLSTYIFYITKILLHCVIYAYEYSLYGLYVCLYTFSANSYIYAYSCMYVCVCICATVLNTPKLLGYLSKGSVSQSNDLICFPLVSNVMVCSKATFHSNLRPLHRQHIAVAIGPFPLS